ncbi:MAG TPA: flavin reductase family protein [Steroidobacteraceae bacterium]|nr:flavin reductase family protein [Steroidobacteraceae bacterium]
MSAGARSATAPRGALDASRVIETRRLRDAFAQFMTGVVVLTTAKAEGGWAAVTVNSFTSVSLDPPLLLWCLGRRANCRRYFERAARFSASILSLRQQKISNNFARPSASTWDDVPVVRTPEGDLLIRGAAATFQCTTHARHRGGDHVILIGRVEKFAVGQRTSPLGFFQGAYGSFTRDQGDAFRMDAVPLTSEDLTLGWG